MKNKNRRNFLMTAGLGLAALPALAMEPDEFVSEEINHIGPKKGFSPHIGSLVSTLDWISNSVFRASKNMSVEQLDYLHDEKSNTVGALIMHLVATEVIYLDMTIHGTKGFREENKARWDTPMNLDKGARVDIKGNPLSYYKEAHDEIRNITKTEFKKKNDDWLLGGATKEWNWNNYCKWFHVVEHYANHRGQITWYAKRMPK
jgi:hypothetical protein